MVGCDHSPSLVDICQERQFQAFVCDALAIPIRSESCDACISIAVIHHLATTERRVAALQELLRLLRPGGKALIYVWAMEQEYNQKKSKYLREHRTSPGAKEETSDCVSAQELPVGQIASVGEACSAHSDPLHNDLQQDGGLARDVPHLKLPVHTNRTSFHSQDLLVPWHLKGNSARNSAEPLGSAGPVLHRFYHVFREGELESVCRALHGATVLRSYYDQGNWCVILEKV